MDRLVIETTLADLDGISVSADQSVSTSALVLLLSFKDNTKEQITAAFEALKKTVGQHPVNFVVCKTMVSGMYDLEIASEAIDEPIRISNKVISEDVLTQLENDIKVNKPICLAVNVADQQNTIDLQMVSIRQCV